MKNKMLIENIKPILIGILSLIAVLLGSLGGGYATAVPAPSVIGALSGPDVYSPYLTVNGFEERFFSSSLNKASTTICSFKTPAATSTLEFGSVQFTTATTTVIAVEVGKSTVYDATTTRLVYRTLAADEQMTLLMATSTPVGTVETVNSSFTFAPSTYLNVKYGGAKGALNVLVGSCKAKFLVN